LLLMLFVGIFTFVLSGCKFGEGDDGLEALAKKKRLLNYHCAFTLPSVLGSDSSFVDLGPDGLNINWDNYSNIGIIGKEFQIKKDTTGEAALPLPLLFSYNRYLSTNVSIENQFTVLSYDFSSYSKHSNGEAYATDVNIVYPFERLIMAKGDTLKANVDSIPLDFHLQDGKLSTIQEKYYIALGRAKAICTNKDVVLIDSACCRMEHDHSAQSDKYVLLDSKIAIIRLSLIVPVQNEYTLLDYLRIKNMSGNSYYIDKIQFSNNNENPAAISRAQLNLTTGWMEAQNSAISYLTITDEEHFWNHQDIAREDAQNWYAVSDEGSSWGTSIYVALPCTQEGQLEISPMVTVTIKQGSSSEVKQFYGTINPVTINEGGYYITSPVRLYESKDHAITPAQIFLTPTCK